MKLSFSVVFVFVIIFTANAQTAIEKQIALAGSFSLKKEYLKAIPLYEISYFHSKEKADFLNASKILNELARANYRAGRKEEAFQLLKKELPEIPENDSGTQFYKAKLFEYFGFLSGRMDNRIVALSSYEQAIKIYTELGTDSKNFAYSCLQAGQHKMGLLDYPTALKYFEKGLTVDSTKEYSGVLFSQISLTHLYLKNIAQAEVFVKAGFKEHLAIKDQYSLNFRAGQIEREKENLKTSIKYFKNALNILIRENTPKRKKHEVYYYLAILNQKIGSDQEFKTYAELCEIEISNSFSRKSSFAAKYLSDLGQSFFDISVLENSIRLQQLALTHAFPTFNSKNILENPPLSQVTVESWQMTASARKGLTLRKLYNENQNLDYLESAAECFDLSLSSHKAIVQTYGTERAKLYLSDYNFNKFEAAIEVQFLLYQKTGEATHLERAFQIMEESKSEILQEAILRNRSLIYANVPDSLMNLEEEYRYSIAAKKKEIQQTETPEALQKSEIELTDLETDYSELIAKIETDFGVFEKENSVTPDLNFVQKKLLQKKEALLEFFEGEEAVFLIAATDEKTDFYKIEKTANYNQLLSDFLNYFKSPGAISESPNNFFQTSNSFYNQLINSELQNLLKEKNTLIIIPAGQLSFVPFDALLTEKQQGSNFQSAPFWVKKANVKYAFSTRF